MKDDELTFQKEQIEYLTQQLYGAKKESIDINPNQSNLFDDSFFSEPEQTGEQSDEEVIIEKHSRRKKRLERTAIKESTNGRSYS